MVDDSHDVIDIANMNVPNVTENNPSSEDIRGACVTVNVRLPHQHRKRAKAILRMGRRDACQYVRETDPSFVEPCEHPEMYDEVNQILTDYDGDEVQLSSTHLECIWDALVHAVVDRKIERDTSVHYIESTLLKADRAIHLHVRGQAEKIQPYLT